MKAEYLGGMGGGRKKIQVYARIGKEFPFRVLPSVWVPEVRHTILDWP